MSPESQPWQSVDADGRLFRAQYQADFGSPFSLLLRLDVCDLVYSPGPELIEPTRALLSDNSRLILVAPSSGHSLGLSPWLQSFPESKLVAGRDAVESLRKKTGLQKFEDVDSLNAELPPPCRLLEAPANAFGEVWLRFEQKSGTATVVWAMCDSLMNLPELGSNPLMRVMLKWYGLAVGPHIHRRFVRSLQDRDEFRRWALEKFQCGSRHLLLPCHGDPLDIDEAELRRLITRFCP